MDGIFSGTHSSGQCIPVSNNNESVLLHKYPDWVSSSDVDIHGTNHLGGSFTYLQGMKLAYSMPHHPGD